MENKRLKFFALMLITFICSCSFVFAANQVSITFTQGTGSPTSKHSIYICNAGLSITQNSGILYYNAISGAQISQATCETNPRDCLTFNLQNQYRKNFMDLTYIFFPGEPLTTGPTPVAVTTRVVSAPSNNPVGSGPTTGTPYSRVGVTGFAYDVSSLKFNLASPVQNAIFFVDVCYRGPEVAYNKLTKYAWAATTSVTTANLSGTDSYVSGSGLTVTSAMTCDVQRLGSAGGTTKYDGINGQDLSDLSVDSADLTTAWNFSDTGEFVARLGNTYTLSSAGTQTLFSAQTVSSGTNYYVPRICKIRYYFQENGTLRSSREKATKFTINANMNVYVKGDD